MQNEFISFLNFTLWISLACVVALDTCKFIAKKEGHSHNVRLHAVLVDGRAIGVLTPATGAGDRSDTLEVQRQPRAGDSEFNTRRTMAGSNDFLYTSSGQAANPTVSSHLKHKITRVVGPHRVPRPRAPR